MDLRERLQLLKAARAGLPPQAEPGPRLDAPAGGEWERTEPGLAEGPTPGTEPQPALLGGALAGLLKRNGAGTCFYVETRYPVEHCRGPLPLAHLFQIDGSAYHLLGRVPRDLDLHHAVFLDTETTGLAGGTGTYAFLVGLGTFEGYDFVVRQFFLRDYGDEEAMLEELEAHLRPHSLLVTFNGKSFDWPLLQTRFRMNRRRAPLPGAPHLDLLHPARRLYKERLGACNLAHLETRVLGVERQGDTPGHLIPQLYFQYLRTGDAGPLADVLLHNRLDIVSLVSLAAWMGQMVMAPLHPTPDGELLCGDDLFALGRLFEDRGLLTEGITCYEAARDRGVAAVGEARALRQLSQAYKRVRAHDQALAIWEAMSERAGALTPYPFVELAKYHEHVSRNYATARAMAVQALEIAQQRRSLSLGYGPTSLQEVHALQHRLARLDRKLDRNLDGA